jgi:isochorismate synthase EntC
MNENQIDQEIELSEFFKLGAFSTDYFSQNLILGVGGEFFISQDIPSYDCFFIKDFFQDQFLIYRPHHFVITQKEKLKSRLNQNEKIDFVKIQDFDEIYKEDFKNLKASLHSTLKKVVLLSKEEYSTAIQPEKFIPNLLRKCFDFVSGNAYGFWNENFGMMGNTPEYLYAIGGNKILTHALAGSARAEEKSFLLQSKKDQEEHQFVIQDIAEKLTPHCKNLTIGNTTIMPYQTMVHLLTPIEGVLNEDWDHKSLTLSLSPTAALGGYPTKEALRFLLNTKYHSLHPERFFGSAFGVQFQSYHQVMVAIRNIQWKESTLWIESGGGIVASSVEEKELQEIQMKRAVIREHYLC